MLAPPKLSGLGRADGGDVDGDVLERDLAATPICLFIIRRHTLSVSELGEPKVFGPQNIIYFEANPALVPGSAD